MRILLVLLIIYSSFSITVHEDHSNLQLCSYNDIGFVPSSHHHVFYVNEIPEKQFKSPNFEVTWTNRTGKDHPFFKAIRQFYDEEQVMSKMKCEPADYKVYETVCNQSPNYSKQNYQNAFGTEPSYKCKIPQNHFGVFLRFVLKLQNLSPIFDGRWAVFAGIHSFNDAAEAYDKIQHQVKKISRLINQTRLTTFNINYQLNIIPNFVAGSLSRFFNYYRKSNFVQNIKTKTPYRLNDEGFIKIIPPGTQFIYGGILNGTKSIKQVCDNFTFPVNSTCGFIGKEKRRKHL